MPTPKNRVVFAPAGSGKTERLSDRYIELLEAGVVPERILTLTFTDKAAAEMKQRIFDRLAVRNPELHRRLRADALKLRVSTIHSFCLTLVRRFAPALGLDPRVDVLAEGSELWNAVKYDTLMTIAESHSDTAAFELLLNLITRDERVGWPRLSALYDRFFDKRTSIARASVTPIDRERLARLAAELERHPLTGRLSDLRTILPQAPGPAAVKAAIDALEAQRDLFLTQAGTPRKPRGRGRDDERAWNELCARYYGLLRADNWAAEFARSFELFRSRFLAAYDRRKRSLGQVDYDDMEFLALHLLEHEPDWQNVLRAFDEHTDHLLVDEFQDTSFLQWGIIDKLTEEWRAGLGAKAERGIEPTVFLVGDDKQSVYMFRDAKVEVFRTAADKLRDWLGADKLESITLEENYRSLDSIIDFNNALFSRLMAVPASGVEREASGVAPWRTRYAPFTRKRNNAAQGTVEILLTPCEGTADERRRADAASVCRRIRTLVNPRDPFTVFDPNPDHTETGRPCGFGDVGILLRSRSLLPALEDALRDARIPFLVAGGTGFYEEPEVRYAIALATALADPCDDLALYATLRGPVFAISERELLLAGTGDGLFLLDRIRGNSAPDSALGQAVATLDRWRALVPTQPLARILESALAEHAVWETFWEPQRVANLRKLLAMIESREAAGEGPVRILRALRDAGLDEAKADVRPEGRNAVQVMTIHAAKGLQFPVVFVPGLDERIRPVHRSSGEELVIEETGPDSVLVSWLPDPGLRRENDFHMTYREKEIEEEKRVFYVACTRARDGLFLTGALHERAGDKSRLGWLVECLGLVPDECRFDPDLAPTSVRVLNSATIPESTIDDLRMPTAPAPSVPHLAGCTLHLDLPAPPPLIRPVTRNTPRDYARSSTDALGLGDIIHKLLEQVSERRLTADSSRLTAEASRLLRLHGLPTSLSANLQSAISNLQSAPALWSIVAPTPNSSAELPVMYSDGTTIYSGRIDRLILTDTEARIYDYKTFPVRPADIDALAREYHEEQLRFYAEAVRRLYPGRLVSTFLIFTALPLLVPTGESY